MQRSGGHGFRLGTLVPWLLLVATPGALFVALRYGPLRNPPPSLQLQAHDPVTGLGENARLILPPDADTSREHAIRLPLLLAIRNTGTRPAEAGRIDLAVPWQIRLEAADGTPFPAEAEGGNPLLHYRLPLQEPLTVPAEQVGVVIPGLERIWVRPYAPSLRCTLDASGVPDFTPTPPLDAELLAQPVIYWSIIESDERRRTSGVLTLQLDPRLFDTPPAPEPPDYPALPLADTAQLPDLDRLELVGHRSTLCGEVIEPVRLESRVYATAGGRILALLVDGELRKLLFDLDGDSTIEAEVWSTTGEKMDRVRRARYRLPEFLLPLPPPPQPPVPVPVPVPAVPDTALADSLAVDTVAVRDTMGVRDIVAGRDTVPGRETERLDPASVRDTAVVRDTTAGTMP
jgi:hypothetical protein